MWNEVFFGVYMDKKQEILAEPFQLSYKMKQFFVQIQRRKSDFLLNPFRLSRLF